MIKIAIVEDQKPIMDGLKASIDSLDEFTCTGQFEDAESIIKQFKNLPVDVVLMDIGLPGINGIECVSRLKKIRPDVNFLMCTVLDDEDKIYDALCAGATGYLLKNISDQELSDAVKQIHAGGSPMTPSIARKIVNSFSGKRKNEELLEALTTREKEVLNLLDKGYPYKIIADKLNIGIPAVKFHIRNIYNKLHVHTRAEALNKFSSKSL
jgi:DNA-binding NarL/FixJ family response regulator